MEIEQEKEYSSYSVRIGKNLYEQIDHHIKLLKYLGENDLKKQDWIIDAITEKMDKEENLPAYALPKEKHLNIKINKHLQKRMERIINSLKSIRRAYSKKQWIIEAIAEKLAEEEVEAKIMANEIAKSESAKH